MSKPSVAIFGLHGALGEPTIKAFESPVFADKFQFPVLAVTRDPSSYTSNDKIKYISGDYINGQEELIKQLKGTDVIVELISPNPQVLAGVEAIVKAVQPKIFVPTQFGTDLEAAREIFPGFLALKSEHSDRVRALGDIKVVDIYNSLFAQGKWLYETVGHVGADLNTKTVTYFGSHDTPIAFTSLDDVGRSIASIASKSPSELPDKLRIQSGEVTAEQTVKRYEETHDVKFEVKDVPLKEALAEAKKVWAEGFNPAKFLYYLQVLGAAGRGKGISFNDNHRELVNPGEKLWTWSKF